MNIALCMFGEPRDIDKSYSSIIKHVIEPNGIKDIFCHFWHDNTKVGSLYNVSRTNGDTGDLIVPNLFVRAETPSLVYNLYNPIKCSLERQIQFEVDKYLTPSFSSRLVVFATQSMAWTINQSIRLLKEYEKKTGITYDAIICTRPDLIYDQNIVVEQLDLNQFNCINDCCHNGGANYWMCVASSDIIKKYGNMYEYIDEFFNSGYNLIPELLVGRFLHKNNIRINTPFASMKVLR